MTNNAVFYGIVRGAGAYPQATNQNHIAGSVCIGAVNCQAAIGAAIERAAESVDNDASRKLVRELSSYLDRAEAIQAVAE